MVNLRQSIGVWFIRKIQRYGPHTVQVLGKTYIISKAVFNPKFYYTSEFMAKHIKVTPEDEVLDMGTGSGIQAITAGQVVPRVIAIDINPEAVRYARKNVKVNGLENTVSVLQGDLFSSLDPRSEFSVILFTPPYLKGTPKTDFDRALFDPNKELVRRFFKDAKEHLKPKGYVQMIYTSIAQPEHVLKIANEFGWKYHLIAKKRQLMETILIYKLTLNQ